MKSLPLSVPLSISVSVGVFPIGQSRCTMKSADWHSNLLNATPTMNPWREFTNRLYMHRLVDEGTAIPPHTFHSNIGLVSIICQQCCLSWMIGVLIIAFANSLIIQIPCPYRFSSSLSSWNFCYVVSGHQDSMKRALGATVWVIHGTPCKFLLPLAPTNISSSLFSPSQPHT